MRTVLRCVLAALMTLALPLSSAAALQISDPDELLVHTLDARTVKLERPKGKLAITFVSWENWKTTSAFNPIVTQLDTKGTTKVDHSLRFGYSPGGAYCGLYNPSGSIEIATGTLTRPDTKTAKCVAPIGKIEISKKIRWRVISTYAGATDRAPDSGFAVGT
jgi:hypothetical protein